MSEPTEAEAAFETYDCDAAFTAEMLPLVEQLIALSKTHGISMLVSFGVAGHADGSASLNTTYLGYSGRIPLAMDQGARIVLGSHYPGDSESEAPSQEA